MRTLTRQTHPTLRTSCNVNRCALSMVGKITALRLHWATYNISLDPPFLSSALENPTPTPIQALGRVQLDPETKNFPPREGSPRVLIGA